MTVRLDHSVSRRTDMSFPWPPLSNTQRLTTHATVLLSCGERQSTQRTLGRGCSPAPIRTHTDTRSPTPIVHARLLAHAHSCPPARTLAYTHLCTHARSHLLARTPNSCLYWLWLAGPWTEVCIALYFFLSFCGLFGLASCIYFWINIDFLF